MSKEGLQPVVRTQLVFRPPKEIPAYYPHLQEHQEPLREQFGRWAEGKFGPDNLVYGWWYGSQVQVTAEENRSGAALNGSQASRGEASRTSLHDFIMVVRDVEAFHRQNLARFPRDYGHPRSLERHVGLNKGEISYYETEVPLNDGTKMRAKYGVLSLTSAIRGLYGVQTEREEDGIGSQGMYIAARLQKAPLAVVYRSDDQATNAIIEESMNAARYDGLWLSLAYLGEEFSTAQMMKEYVLLSYRADPRPEGEDKVQAMIKNSRGVYQRMITSLLADFSRAGIVEATGEGMWKKLQGPSQEEVEERIVELREKTKANSRKNLKTYGYGRGVVYAAKKGVRIITKKIDQRFHREDNISPADVEMEVAV